MSIDPITRRIIDATRVRFDACKHENIVEPPPGKHLRVCLDCGCRLIECGRCNNMTFARADIAEEGWRSFGDSSGFIASVCPEHGQ